MAQVHLDNLYEAILLIDSIPDARRAGYLVLP